MKKKGFTLIELLAVIVILAIIALIAIPLIGNVIEKAKIGALESSVNGLVESANMYYANNIIKGETVTETIFDFEEGEQISTQKLEYKGKVYNGKLILHANGEIAVCIDDEEHYAYKNKDTDEIVSGNGTCLYDGTTGDFSSNSLINDLRGKTLVATDISKSADSLNAIIKIPEEGHYDKNSEITIPIETIENEVNLSNVYYLGQGTSFDVKSLLPNIDYTKLTIDNFIVEIVSMPSAAAGVVLYSAGGNWGGAVAGGFNTSKTYNTDTGILTISAKQTITRTCNNSDLQTFATQTAVTNVYLVGGEIKSLS